jgi:glycosyltransferase involved in cell wall biosynthesis
MNQHRMAKRIFFTVTNDLTYDQRMRRICTSLSKAGYDVTLVGFLRPGSVPLKKEAYKQKRFRLFFLKGGLFYAEYNIRLLIYFLFKKMDAICAIDLDTILPCLAISKWKRIPRIYDAHELFTELKEVVSRPAIKRKWDRIEKHAVPQFPYGYTVAQSIAEELNKKYKVHYKVIRNITVLKETVIIDRPGDFILYQGAVNEGRCLEYIIPAMKEVNSRLVICGDGNFMDQLRELIVQHNVEDKVELKGMVEPEELWNISLHAQIGLTIIENIGLNQYFSLPNKFFDYIHAGIPQIAMNYPEYERINKQFEVAVLLDSVEPKKIAAAINNLLQNDVLYNKLRANCLKARQELNWQQEEKKLLEFYQSVIKA